MDSNDALERLAAVKAKRGYLLPHHGLMALTAPQLLDGYDACYTALTLVPRALSEHAREFVWLGVLTARREHIAAQHLVKFLKAGGTQAEVERITRMVAVAEGAGAFAFIPTHWNRHLPAFDGARLYLDATGAGDDALAHLALCAVHGCLRQSDHLRLHITACARLAAPETHLAEALSYIMFSGSVPYFIEACTVWRDMIRAGDIEASAPFRAWAAMDLDGPE